MKRKVLFIPDCCLQRKDQTVACSPLYSEPIRFTIRIEFIDAGYASPLMYLNNSPWLLRVKREGKK